MRNALILNCATGRIIVGPDGDAGVLMLRLEDRVPGGDPAQTASLDAQQVREIVAFLRDWEQPALPPTDFDAEQAVLGTLLRWPHFHDAISSEIKGEAFADPLHGRLFARVVQCLRDPAFQLEELPGAVEAILDEVGGLPYLSQLKQHATDIVSALLAARRVVEAWAYRQAEEHRGAANSDRSTS